MLKKAKTWKTQKKSKEVDLSRIKPKKSHLTNISQIKKWLDEQYKINLESFNSDMRMDGIYDTTSKEYYKGCLATIRNIQEKIKR